MNLLEILPLSPLSIVVFFIQSTVFFALIFLAGRMLQKGSATSRRFLWFWAVMLLPAMTVLATQLPVVEMNTYVAEFLETQSLQFSEEAAVPNPAVASPSGAATSEATVALRDGTTAGQSPWVSQILQSVNQWNWLVLAYGLAVLILLVRIPIGWAHLVSLRKAPYSDLDAHGSDIFSDVSAELEYRGNCKIRLTEQVESPISFGIFKPLILVPESYYKQLSDTELRTTIVHELTHVQNNDPLRILLLKIVESVFFFQPLVWLASRKVQYFSELIADDSVLEAGVSADRYANAIVNLIELGTEPRQQFQLSTGIFSAPEMLVSRIEYLLDDSALHNTKLIGGGVLASFLVLVFALVAAVQLTPNIAAANDSVAGVSGLDVEPETVFIPNGSFIIGATPEQIEDLAGFNVYGLQPSFYAEFLASYAPQKEVYIDEFYLYKYEVTNAQYQAFTQATGRKPSANVDKPRMNRPQQPVSSVTWHDANDFCTWAGGRLPTEAEWEKAARGPNGFLYPWGNEWDPTKLHSIEGIAEQSFASSDEWTAYMKSHAADWNQYDSYPELAEVGSYLDGASPYGAMDMAGNVREWVNDWYNQFAYNYAEENPQGPETGEGKMHRGGAWLEPKPVQLSWFRARAGAHQSQIGIGFRCAVDV